MQWACINKARRITDTYFLFIIIIFSLDLMIKYFLLSYFNKVHVNLQMFSLLTLQ